MGTIAEFYLASCLAPLASSLERADVTDIYINKPGEVWLETCDGHLDRLDTPELTTEHLLRMARQVAAASSQGISRDHPLLAASLPTGERVQVALPPATRGMIAMAIRKHVVPELKLDDYPASFIPEAPRVSRGIDQALPNVAAFLRDAVRSRQNILVSGGTSSGKTTLLNALIREIPAHERLITIEDTPELLVPHENSVGLIAPRGSTGEAQVSAEDLLIASLRLRPDRIILGEIRGGEAFSFLRAINSGHPGSFSTIHANSPAGAIDQLALLVLQTGVRMDWQDVLTYVRRALGIVVQVRRGAEGRRIDAISVFEDGRERQLHIDSYGSQ